MKIFDGFLFFNEFDVLELRLNELCDVVDYFVLVEAPCTHTGQPKPLYFREQAERFRPFADKIIHIIVDDMPATADPWQRDSFQRNAIARGLGDLAADDFVMISDVDEIPRREVVAALRQERGDMVGLRMPLSYFRVNFVNVQGAPHTVWTVAVRGRCLTTPQAVRDSRARLARNRWRDRWRCAFRVIPYAGWHFSYLGGEEHVRGKVRAFTHQEFNRDELMAGLDLEQLMAGGRDVFQRPGFTWTTVAVDDTFPQAIRHAPERFASYIAAHPVTTMAALRPQLDAAAQRRSGLVRWLAGWRGATANV